RLEMRLGVGLAPMRDVLGVARGLVELLDAQGSEVSASHAQQQLLARLVGAELGRPGGSLGGLQREQSLWREERLRESDGRERRVESLQRQQRRDELRVLLGNAVDRADQTRDLPVVEILRGRGVVVDAAGE